MCSRREQINIWWNQTSEKLAGERFSIRVCQGSVSGLNLFSLMYSVQSQSVLMKCAEDSYMQGIKYNGEKKWMTLQTPVIEMELHEKAWKAGIMDIQTHNEIFCYKPAVLCRKDKRRKGLGGIYHLNCDKLPVWWGCEKGKRLVYLSEMEKY